MTTAINILATFRLVFNWLSRLRLAEFIVVTPLLESSLFRLTNLMVVLHVLQKKRENGYDILLFFLSHVPRKRDHYLCSDYGGWPDQESYGRFLFFSFFGRKGSQE